MRNLFYFAFAIGWLCAIQDLALGQKVIERGGMTVSYQIQADSLEVEVTAPTQGWLALGFNLQNEIVGSDLKMIRIIDQKVEAQDQVVRSAGVHPQDLSIDGKNELRIIHGQESSGKSQVSFRMPLNSGDSNDLTLRPGAKVWLIMAYSVSDDFEHHSRMRQHVEIQL